MHLVAICLRKFFLLCFLWQCFFCVYPWVWFVSCVFFVFSVAVFIMDAASDSQCGDNRGEDRGTENSNDRMKFKNRRKA